MNDQIQSELEILKKAQGIDAELYKLLGLLEELPADRAAAKKELETEMERLKELDGTLKKRQLAQKEKEGTLAQKETNVKKMEGQLSQVKTNKEYAALQQEIASLKADNSLMEEEILRLFDEVEACREELTKEQVRVKEFEKVYLAKEQEIGKREKEVQAQVQQLKSQKEESVTQLSPETKQLYNRIVEKKNGIALVPVAGEVCSGCQIRLRAQTINEVMMGKTLVLCDNCSRILYIAS